MNRFIFNHYKDKGWFNRKASNRNRKKDRKRIFNFSVRQFTFKEYDKIKFYLWDQALFNWKSLVTTKQVNTQ